MSGARGQKVFEKSLGKCKKSGCSLCKSENPLYKKIPSEKIYFYIRTSDDLKKGTCTRFSLHSKIEKKLVNTLSTVIKQEEKGYL